MECGPPTTYAAWRHQLEVGAGIPLTADFLRQRIQALEDATDAMTIRFVERYGEAHRAQVLAWFRQALAELEPETENHG